MDQRVINVRFLVRTLKGDFIQKITVLTEQSAPKPYFFARMPPPVHDTLNSRWTLPPKVPRIRGKIVFLADANAISQSESILGIVEYYELGEIVGERTAGVTGNSNPIMLPGGFSVGWTGMRVRKHNGELHHITGIAPTVPVAKTVDGLISGRDEILERALALVRGS